LTIGEKNNDNKAEKTVAVLHRIYHLCLDAITATTAILGAAGGTAASPIQPVSDSTGAEERG
jgi:hypothetical protein